MNTREGEKMKKVFVVMATIALLCMDMNVQAAPVQWSGNGHWYDAISFGSNWRTQHPNWIQSKSMAESSYYQGIQGHLATITSQEENDFITSAFPESWQGEYGYFLGGYQDMADAYYSENAGGWKWVTGEPWSEFVNWRSGEPCGGSSDNALAFHLNGQWNDVDHTRTSDTARGYVVEYEAVVPEPSSIIALLGGMISLLGIRRRRA